MTLTKDQLRMRDDVILRTIARSGGLGYVDLGAVIDRTGEVARKCVLRLEAAGLVTREERAHKSLRLTSKGLKRIKELDDAVR